MTREMRDLETRLAAAEERVRALLAEDKLAEAEKAMDEVRAIRKKIDMLKELEAEERREAEAARPAGEVSDEKELEARYTEAVLKAIRRRPLSAGDLDVVSTYRRRIMGVMHEGGVTSDPEGDSSLVVPQDIQTRINTVMRSLVDLSEFVRRETVRTMSGTRVLEADEDMTPLQAVNEYDQLQQTDNPKFVPITYRLVKRAGFLPLTSELISDSDQNLIAYLSDWIARKVVVTRNSLITAVFNGLTSTDITGHDGLRQALNVALDPSISLTATILTNQSGFNWLDSQEDNQGRPLLQPDPTQQTRMLYKGRPIVVVADRYLPNEVRTGTPNTIWAPFIVGNLRQAVVHFTRGIFELASTREGGEAWRRDALEMRVITRDDVKTWDAGAVVRLAVQVG